VGGTLCNLGYEIYGTEGVLRGYGTLFQLSGHPGEPIPIRLELDRFGEAEAVAVDEVHNVYQAVIGRHAESILSGVPLDAGDALHNLELVLACYASADRHGQWIEFP
jgi:predicted dehydrogenase